MHRRCNMEMHPELVEFAREADEQMARDYHGGFFRMSEKLRSLVCGTDVLSRVAAAELRKIAGNPVYESPRWEPDYIVMANGPKWQLRVGFYSRSSEFVYTMPQHMVVVVAGQQALAADHYTLPQGIDIGTFDSALRLESAVRRVHAPGDLITIDSRHDLFDVMVEAKVLVVKFVSTAHHPLQWAFHRDTGQALQAIAADPVDSELVSMSRTLGAMMNRAAVPALSHLCDHQQYFVRWAAMQALGYVAPELLVPRLKVAEEDPHPHIRAAAHKAFNRILPQG
ncbi:hypothetical protein BRN33_19380 [Xanthomonas oryzae pv. oryzae]|nr:hypothetical protein BRL93_20035 [Xanthomonas oryzae pv. oryzae]RBJ40117.1 hypothetical protein BRN91_12930 [Xanthomonas oryzae pv. oryzae]RBL08210.1 hypothetical protein BRN33_19380 [Xanthomonas oryzae pv. oryzae]UWU51676.1 HEAT repeat domain-containing protein [Xanthomonas oryzae pv. oryzae]UXV88787.1 hypothetical protein IXO597_000685 [Xanthomonas oryzae pv. oryzae]